MFNLILYNSELYMFIYLYIIVYICIMSVSNIIRKLR